MASVSPATPLSVQLITDASADETLSQWVDVRGASHLTFYCTSTGTTSSGVITFEESAPANFKSVEGLNPPPTFGATTGGYSAITTQNASGFTGGAQIAVHPAEAAFCFVRARISTIIAGGGTVSVNLVAY